MLKRIFAIAMAALLILSLGACSNQAKGQLNTTESNGGSENKPPEQVSEPLENSTGDVDEEALFQGFLTGGEWAPFAQDGATDLVYVWYSSPSTCLGT